jgi:general stress protein YciG
VIAYLQTIASQGGQARSASMTPKERQQVARQGGQARAKQMTAEQRRERAQRAARARWASKRKG